MHRWLGLAALLASACTPPTVGEDVTSRDATRDGPRGPCVTDRDCDDAIFCNGAERCMPGASGADMFGCLPPSSSMPCLASQTCSESMQRCRSDCGRAPDADGDGHRAAECGGDDCDDADANRFPGNPEVCDGSHDEDCVVVTVGTRDNDRDGVNSSVCCNVVPGSAVSCGADCDDARADIGPGSAEVCDGIDNNCNGVVDEGTLQQAFRPDCDGDGFGSTSATPIMACARPTTLPPCTRTIPASTWSTSAGDCQDDDETIHVGVPELCDGVDNNCDGTVDENPGATASCGSVPLGTPTCTSGRCIVACTSPAADCDGVFDNGCEIDLSTSNANCGGCGHRCSSGEQCVASVCVPLLCPPGTHDCGGRCVSDNSIDSCGSRCSPCPRPPHSVASCEGIAFQTCILTCEDNYVEIHEECAPAALLRSPRHGAVLATRRPAFAFDCVECSDATVQLATDAAFTSPIAFTGFAPMITADRDVAAGRYFWRVQYPSPAPATAPPPPVASLFLHDPPVGATRPVAHVLYDYNGDARVDTAIGAPASSATGAGSVFVYDGTGAGFASSALEIVAPAGEPSFGATIANAGDVNGDGRSDLVVGAPDHLGNVGRVYVFVSRSTPGIGTPVVLEALEPMHHFGLAITGGDFDGDGFADVAVAEGNAIDLYYGRPSGIRTVPDRRFSIDTGTANGDVAALASGDVNGDGYDDLLIGADRPDTAMNLSAVPSVIVSFGFDYSVTEGPSPETYSVAGRVVGTHLAFAGDLDGNGYGDIVASSYAGTDRRGVLFLGNGSGAPTVVEILATPFTTDFASGVSWGGDMDGDGYDDVLFATGNASFAVLYGSAGLGVAPAIGTTLTFNVPADVGFGWSMLGVGDVDGDHFGDVIVGAGGSTAGSAVLVSGGMAGLTMSSTFNTPRPVPRFGTSVACRSEGVRARRGPAS